MEEIMKIRIAIPHPPAIPIHKKCKESIDNLINARKEGIVPWELEVISVESTNIAQGRNELCTIQKSSNNKQEFKLDGKKRWQKIFDYKYLLFVDSDQSFTVDQFINFINSVTDENSIYCGVIEPRNGQGRWNVGGWDTENNKPTVYMQKDYTSGISSVAWCGAGFLLIPSEVFKKLPYPWFCEREIEQTNGDIILSSEDVGFCLKCKDYNIDIKANFDIQIAHHCYDTLSILDTSRSPFATKINEIRNNLDTQFEDLLKNILISTINK